jgi:proteasome accessory factor A
MWIGDLDRAPKVCGGDIELGNFISGVDSVYGTGRMAARLLLNEIHGYPVDGARSTGYKFNPQDWGRQFLKENGGCAYIDLDHLELALPEVRSAYDHLACWHAMLRIARDALDAVNERLLSGRRIVALVNNSDGQGNSYGSHLDFLITRRAWDNIFQRRMHHLLVLASYQASSLVFTGQGKVGSENGRPPVDYQISQRADFFEVLVSIETMLHRPLVNSRDEPLCGKRSSADGAFDAASRLARLHCIFYDNTLCHAASLLKVGVMQIILAMIEADQINPALILDQPLDAVQLWSRDPSLRAQARLIGGELYTAVDLQLRFLEEATVFVESGGCDGVVPRAREILNLWADTLEKLKTADFSSLARRLDWVLKQSLIQRTMDRYPELTWTSPELKRLDLMYSSLGDGLYWACERQGQVERLVTDGQIERFVHEPPDDTRAWTRARLLRCAKPHEVEKVDWDELRFWCRDAEGESLKAIRLSNPLAHTRSDCHQVFQQTNNLPELLDRLGAESESRLITPSWRLEQPSQPLGDVT